MMSDNNKETISAVDSFVSDNAIFTTVNAEKIYSDLPEKTTDTTDVEVIGPVKTILPTAADAVFDRG